jgi:hypothetical protein
METNTTTITDTMTPTEIDTIYLEQSWIAVKNFSHCQSLRNYCMSAVGTIIGNKYDDKSMIVHPVTEERLTWTEAKQLAETAIAANDYKSYNKNGCSASIDYLAECDKFNDNFQSAVAIMSDADEQWIARQWNRYFLVCSSNGHIHSSTNCHTCNKGKNATQFALVPSLSGTSVDDAVAKLGAGLCSVCFPDAPVEYREQVKISKSQATILLEQGEAAYDTAVAKAAERKAKKAMQNA